MCMDALCELLHLLRQVVHPLGQFGVLRKELLLLRGDLVAMLRGCLFVSLVAIRLASLGQEDEGRRIGGLRGEGEVQQDEGIRVPSQADRKGIERYPNGNGEALPEDVSRSAEEAGRLLRNG